MTPIPRAERLIVALDVATPNEAKALVERLGGAARFYKVGLELFMAGGYFELLEWLVKRGNKVFVDLKFVDVAQAFANGADYIVVGRPIRSAADPRAAAQ